MAVLQFKLAAGAFFLAAVNSNPRVNSTARVNNVQVFTLGGNSWRSNGEAGYQINPFSSQGYVLHGKMHWLTRLGSYYGHYDRLIVSFDLADEVFGEVPKVDFNVDLRKGKFHLAVLRGRLAVAINFPHQDRGGTEIWVMREYNVKKSWVKEFLKNGELLLDYRCGSLISYDPQNGVFKMLKFQGMPNLCEGMPNLFQMIVHVGGLNWIDIPPADL
uniref:F-box protein At3g07870-like n=1 Tax=Nicotiana tabacum TaxID=4097 RepID=A0A1S4BMF5_TOBAC|nr:PREDICTED: F-box protein At3g07870-like [Nicotiana tabacum]